MLNYKVTCDNCLTTILLTEKTLMQSSSLVCPECNSKLSANELKHLKSDLQYRKKHPGFHVSISDTQNVVLAELGSYALSKALGGLSTLFNDESLSQEEFEAFTTENKYLSTFCNLYSRHLLVAYHRKIAAILKEQDIIIGDIITDSPPMTSVSYVPPECV